MQVRTGDIKRFHEAHLARKAQFFPLAKKKPCGNFGRVARVLIRSDGRAHALETGVFFGPPSALVRKEPTAADIIQTVVGMTGFSRSILVSQQRTKLITQPRQVAMAAAVQWTDLSLPRVGQIFGGRDHTTVLHAIRQVELRRAKGHERTVELIVGLESWLGQKWIPDERPVGYKPKNGYVGDSPWTGQRIAQLESLWAAGVPRRLIVDLLGGGVSQTMVQNKIHHLRSLKPDALAKMDRQRSEAKAVAREEGRAQ